jgi:hypothetical protein
VKVDMSKIPGYTGPAYPFYSTIEVVTATCTAPYNHRAIGFKNYENAFFLASTILASKNSSLREFGRFLMAGLLLTLLQRELGDTASALSTIWSSAKGGPEF